MHVGHLDLVDFLASHEELGVPTELAIVIMGVFIASFAGTTLDTATRIQRYVIAEIATTLNIKFLAKRYAATTFAVVTAAALAFATGANGKGALKLWPLFGAVNQLMAALVLLLMVAVGKVSPERQFGLYLTAVLLLLLVSALFFLRPLATSFRGDHSNSD